MRMGIALGSGLLVTLPACAPPPWAPPEGCEVEEPTTLPLVLSVHRDLDLVFVIDDGIERSAAVTRSLEHLAEMVDDLARSDLDDDGVRDVPDWRSVRVAVIGSDRGVPGIAHLPGCEDAGRRAHVRVGEAPACEVPAIDGLSPGILELGPALAAPSDPRGLACLLSPSSACALPQPLESALETLAPLDPARWPGGDPPLFLDEEGREVLPGLACAAGEACTHAGLWPRDVFDERLLVIVVLTERDDCSLTDASWLHPSLSLPAACARAHELGQLRPVDRYLAGLMGPRPGRMIFALQGGIPADAVTLDRYGPYESDELAVLVADPRLEPVYEAGSIEPSCATGDVSASPPTRLLAMAQGLLPRSGEVVLGSICESGGEFAARVRSAILEATRAPCSPPYRFSIAGHGSVLDRCVVHETLPPGARCAEREGRTRIDVDAEGREVCALARVAPDATVPGWFFDEALVAREQAQLCLSPHLGAVRVTEATTPRGAIEVTCRYREHASDPSDPETMEPDFLCDAERAARSPCREGMICRAEDDRCGLGGTGLVCDALRLTCAPRCQRDEECPMDRSLRPGVCDRRTVAEAARGRDMPLWLLAPELLEVPRHVCGTLECRAP